MSGGEDFPVGHAVPDPPNYDRRPGAVQHKAIPGPTVQPVPANWRDQLAEIRDQLEEGDDHE